jgi:hypothetical protein
LEGGGAGHRPAYATEHKIAKHLGVRVWELESVPIHYQQEALVIMRAERQARFELAKRHKVPVHHVPEF